MNRLVYSQKDCDTVSSRLGTAPQAVEPEGFSVAGDVTTHPAIGVSTGTTVHTGQGFVVMSIAIA